MSEQDEAIEEAELQAELASVYAIAKPGHIAQAFLAAVQLGEMEAALSLLAMLSRKDPHMADIIVRTIRYKEPS